MDAPHDGLQRVFVIGETPDLHSVFQGLPYRVSHYSDPESAMEDLWREQPELIITSYPYLHAVRIASPGSKTIVLGFEGRPEGVIQALRRQAFAFFSVPYDYTAIREMVIQAMSEPGFDDGIQLISGSPEFLTLYLRCRLSTADRLVRFFSQMRTEMTPEERAKAATAFREMLINAIEHGGQLNPNQWVRVSRVRTERTLVYYIKDPGNGFSREDLSHAAISNPEDSPMEHLKTRTELGLRAGGFGMLLASELVDEVIYNEQGNEVILIKHLPHGTS